MSNKAFWLCELANDGLAECNDEGLGKFPSIAEDGEILVRSSFLGPADEGKPFGKPIVAARLNISNALLVDISIPLPNPRFFENPIDPSK